MDTTKENAQKGTKPVKVDLAKMPAPEPTYSPSMLDDFIKRHSTPAEDGSAPPGLTRDTATIVIEPRHCARGAWVEPFRLTLVELDPRQELEAMREAGMRVDADGKVESMGGPETLIMSLGRSAIRDFNGRRMTSDEKRMVWDSMKLPARLACGKVYGEHLTGLEAGLGEIIASVEIG